MAPLTDKEFEQLLARVAVNTDNITRLFAEQEHIRERLHTLEGDRATVLLLASKVDALGHKLDELTAGIAEMVAQAADRAARRVGEHQAQLRRSDWRFRLTVLSSVVAAVGVIVGLLTR